MRVEIMVGFDVTSDESGLDEADARAAAESAAFHNLALTRTGIKVVESVAPFVDGFGACRVELAE